MNHHPWPLHRRLAIVGWTCAILFAAILIADEICKHTGLPRVEQWPFFGIPLTFFPLPLLAGTVISLPLASILRRRAPFAPHCCQHCGYDRRGLSLDAPCPECGAAPDA